VIGFKKMDVTLLSQNSIKIKSKKASLIFDPVLDMQKNNADAVILLSDKSFDLKKVEDYRVVISGPGEYEVGRIKINGVGTGSGTVYSLVVDGVNVLVGRGSDLSLIADKNQEHKVAVIKVDSEIKESIVTSIEPRLIILYGEKTDEAVKALGKEKKDIEVGKKLSFNEDKLPEEMGVAVLS